MAGGISAFAMSYADGAPLARLEDDLSPTACRDLCEQIAIAAAQIHAVTFARRGMFGPGLMLTPFEEDGRPAFLELCLENADLRRRVGPERFARLSECVAAHAALGRPYGAPELCHSDFNLKNLLGAPLPNGKVKLSAVLDWEFAFVNAAETDIGNLLRFEDESPSIDAAWFANAYVGAGAHLERDWRERALYADLSAQTSFLISREELPRTFATAVSVIDRTLARLAP
jgi:Ser/Thr protein kinase RdoA (MazF antagonist)